MVWGFDYSHKRAPASPPIAYNYSGYQVDCDEEWYYWDIFQCGHVIGCYTDKHETDYGPVYAYGTMKERCRQCGG